MPLPECVFVAKNLFGLWARTFTIVGKTTKQIIVGGHDVFNFGGKLGLLQANGLNQNPLIGQKLGSATQIGHRCTRGNDLLQNSLALQICRWRKQRQIVVRL